MLQKGGAMSEVQCTMCDRTVKIPLTPEGAKSYNDQRGMCNNCYEVTKEILTERMMRRVFEEVHKNLSKHFFFTIDQSPRDDTGWKPIEWVTYNYCDHGGPCPRREG